MLENAGNQQWSLRSVIIGKRHGPHVLEYRVAQVFNEGQPLIEADVSVDIWRPEHGSPTAICSIRVTRVVRVFTFSHHSTENHRTATADGSSIAQEEHPLA